MGGSWLYREVGGVEKFQVDVYVGVWRCRGVEMYVRSRGVEVLKYRSES